MLFPGINAPSQSPLPYRLPPPAVQSFPLPLVPDLAVPLECFVPAGPEPHPDPWIDADDEEDQLGIPTFKEKSYICLAYLQAVMGNIFGKLTWEYATQQLCNSLDLLAISG